MSRCQSTLSENLSIYQRKITAHASDGRIPSENEYPGVSSTAAEEKNGTGFQHMVRLHTGQASHRAGSHRRTAPAAFRAGWFWCQLLYTKQCASRPSTECLAMSDAMLGPSKPRVQPKKYATSDEKKI